MLCAGSRTGTDRLATTERANLKANEFGYTDMCRMPFVNHLPRVYMINGLFCEG
jgi:hypothetical protein